MSGLSGVEIKAAIKKGRFWNVPEVAGANNGVLILPTNLKRDAPIDIDDSLGLYFSKEGLSGPIKVEGDISTYLRYDGLNVLLALFMGVAGVPVQQGATAAYAFTYKLQASLDGLFGSFVKNMKSYVQEHASVKVVGLTIKGESGKSLQAIFGGIANNQKIIPSRNIVEATITVGASPRAIAYCPSNGRVYVANTGTASVSVIDPGTNTVVATITVGTSPYAIAYCPSNDRVYVANYGAASVSVINPGTNTVVATITVGTNPDAIAYCPSNDRVYVANYGAASVSVIDPGTNTVVATITVGASPYAIAYCPSNNRVYVANVGAASVSVIDPGTNTVVATITMGANPYAIAYCPSNDRVYVANAEAASVSVVIPGTNTVVATITMGASPYAIAYCPSNNRVYVANAGAASVSVIDPGTNTVVATITVGASPLAIAYCPSNGRVYVANTGAASVSVVIPECNTLSTFTSVTNFEESNRVRFSEGVFCINNQVAGALGSADKIYPASFELTAKRKVKGEYTGEYKTYSPNVQDIIDEPCNDGMPEIILKLTFPRHTSSANIAALISDTRKKMDITFTGALIAGSYYRQFRLLFPHLQLKDVPVADAQGNIKEPLEFIVHGCDTAPTGMTGLTDPFWICGINTLSTDPLA